MASQDNRTVHLPLDKLDKCTLCSKTSDLRLCSGCGESIYCSKECQRRDWTSSHKAECKLTDRVDLATFYPFLACLIEYCHVKLKPHSLLPGLNHRIITDDCNPASHPYDLPDGTAAKLVMLGEPYYIQSLDDSEWWPYAVSDKARRKLVRRIMREGYVLPILTALCFALVSEMYTTEVQLGENEAQCRRRTRLRYRSSQLADFGICSGSARVTSQDQLAYLDLSAAGTGTFIKGQDPNDHYWLYFRTIQGEEVVLDCAMFTFNMSLQVPSLAFGLTGAEPWPFEVAPAFFGSRTVRQNTPPGLHTERRRLSALRHPGLRTLVARMSPSWEKLEPSHIDVLAGFMESLSGRMSTAIERELLGNFAAVQCSYVEGIIKTRGWQNFPKAPPIMVEPDDGEMDDINDRLRPTLDRKKLAKKMKKYARDGVITKHTMINILKDLDETFPDQ